MPSFADIKKRITDAIALHYADNPDAFAAIMVTLGESGETAPFATVELDGIERLVGQAWSGGPEDLQDPTAGPVGGRVNNSTLALFLRAIAPLLNASAGAASQRGPPGRKGEFGPKGRPGQPGRRGLDGASGVAGKAGPPGRRPQDGGDGRRGPPGPRGAPGGAGPTGAAGRAPPGRRGADGEDGRRGPPGPRGASGVGADGRNGPAGRRGADGQDGRRGPPGQPQRPRLPYDYITGLRLTWVSVSQVRIEVGRCRDATDQGDIVLTATATAAITSSGAGGLDTGVEAANTWYYVWAIGKTDGTTAALLSVSSTSPTMPAGYTWKRRVGAVRNSSGSNFFRFWQTEARASSRRYDYDETDGTLGALSAGAATVFTNVSLATFMPPTSTIAIIRVQCNAVAGCNVRPDTWATSAGQILTTTNSRVSSLAEILAPGQIIEYQNTLAGGSSGIVCQGFLDSL